VATATEDCLSFQQANNNKEPPDARRELKFLRTRLGRIIRDIRRKIEGNTALENRFGPLLDLAPRRITAWAATILFL
jgi:hypothetical protein